jgi:lysozyme
MRSPRVLISLLISSTVCMMPVQSADKEEDAFWAALKKKLAKLAKPEKNTGHAHAGTENKGLEPQPPSRGLSDRTQKTMGIDVSEFQKTIDWSKAKNAGVRFAFIRATEGSSIKDYEFLNNWKNAKKAGVRIGPYHYFTTTSSIETQVDNFVNSMAKVDPPDLPPVLDVELPAQFAQFTPKESVALVQHWLDGVEQKMGVRPLLYMSSSFSGSVLGSNTALNSYKLWVADYTKADYPVVGKPWLHWTFWQHADNGHVPGIEGDLDMDLFNGEAEQLADVNNFTPVQSSQNGLD